MIDFTKGNATKQIVSFAIPMLIGNVFQQLYSMADAIVVGRFVSGGALAAVGASTIILNFVLSVLIGLTTGASVVISQLYGAKRENDLKRSVSTSLIFILGFTAVISIVGYFAAPWFLRTMSVPENIYFDAKVYLQLLLSCSVFPAFYNIYAAFLRALGDSKRPLYILIFTTVMNMALDLLFVISFGMGVMGVALATIVSQALSAVVCYLYSSRQVAMLRIEKLVLDKLLLRQILKYSIPAAIQHSLTSLANLTISRLVNSFGSSSIAGYTAAVRIDQFAMMPLSNLSMAISTFVGQNMGAGFVDRAKKGFRNGLLMMLSLSVIMSVIILILGQPLISVFINGSDADYSLVVEVGTKYISTLAYFYFLFAVFFAFNGFFRGVGDAIIVMALTITSLSIRAISAHLLVSQFGMGPEAVAFSIPIGWGLCSLFCFFYYKKGFWEGKSITSTKLKNA